MSLHQVSKRSGTIRVPRGETPLIELDLQSNERIVNVELRRLLDLADRKTVDWTWSAYIDNDLSAFEFELAGLAETVERLRPLASAST